MHHAFSSFFLCHPCTTTTRNGQILCSFENGNGKAINSNIYCQNSGAVPSLQLQHKFPSFQYFILLFFVILFIYYLLLFILFYLFIYSILFYFIILFILLFILLFYYFLLFSVSGRLGIIAKKLNKRSLFGRRRCRIVRPLLSPTRLATSRPNEFHTWKAVKQAKEGF